MRRLPPGAEEVGTVCRCRAAMFMYAVWCKRVSAARRHAQPGVSIIFTPPGISEITILPIRRPPARATPLPCSPFMSPMAARSLFSMFGTAHVVATVSFIGRRYRRVDDMPLPSLRESMLKKFVWLTLCMLRQFASVA